MATRSRQGMNYSHVCQHWNVFKAFSPASQIWQKVGRQAQQRTRGLSVLYLKPFGRLTQKLCFSRHRSALLENKISLLNSKPSPTPNK